MRLGHDEIQMSARVLIVEDDEAMSVALRDGFQYEGYAVTLARDGEVGLQMAMATTDPPDLILLDVMLPKMTGLDVCRQLRSGGHGVPIIMLTARGQEIDKVLGLKLGADDYITKPFGFMELLARAEAVLRRSRSSVPSAEPLEAYRFGDVDIDFRRHEARKGGEAIDLSPREFQLLAYFIQHRGEIVTRETLLDTVWDYNAIPFTRTVDMHIAKLRKKVEDNPADPKHVITVHRLGYKFTG
jgi:DNA-binding response OmpR family regulator